MAGRSIVDPPARTEPYTLSLHDALPISCARRARFALRGRPTVLRVAVERRQRAAEGMARGVADEQDRKSTRLNSGHSQISYAVFCLKKKSWCPPCRPRQWARPR